VIAVAAMILLNRTVFGRYLMAIGSNVDAARYSGINTDRVTTMAYVICATLAGIGGMLFVLDLNQAQPSSSATSTNSTPSPPPSSGVVPCGGEKETSLASSSGLL